MSQRVIRFQIDKNKVKPESVSELPSELRKLIQNLLFEFLREINDKTEKALKSLSSREAADVRSTYPATQGWKNPSHEEIRQFIQTQESAEDASGGWMYAVKEEGLFVNGILKIHLVGHQSKLPMAKLMRFHEIPGFYVSEDVTNE
jgi:hypothetical protein